MGSMRGTIARLGVFVVICLLCAFALTAVVDQFRFTSEERFRAEFTDVTGLRVDDFVRIAGVEVGKVKAITVNDAGHAVVEFTTDSTVVLTEGTRATIRWADPVGKRYLSLQEGTGNLKRLAAGQMIPVTQTEPALDIDTLLGGFRPLFRALDPQQVNTLSNALIQVFQDQGATINSFLAQAATATSTLADRDQLIGEVITNLNTVLGTLGDNGSQVAKAVDSLTAVMETLSARRTDIANAIANTDAATASVADLLRQARPAFSQTIQQTDRAAGIIVADHKYVENLLDTLPDAYRQVGRLGLYGDSFPFYLCDLLLKVNGKGGQPVYVKVVGQDSGRCAPK